MSLQVNIGGSNKRSTDMWCKIDDSWKRIDRIMIKVEGVWKDGQIEKMLSYYGALEDIPLQFPYPSGGTVGNYALFTYGNSVYSYNTSLIRAVATNLPIETFTPAVASIGNYVLFAGGKSTSSGYGVVAQVVAYNSSLVQTTATSLSTGRQALAGASVGAYAIFAGGLLSAGTNRTAVTDAFNTSLVRTTPTQLSVSKMSLCGVGIENYAIFAGGNSSVLENHKVVNAFNASLTRSIPTPLTVDREALPKGVRVGKYALIGGGVEWGRSNRDLVESFNTSLVKTDLVSTLDDTNTADFGVGSLFGHGLFVSTNCTSFNSALVKKTLPGTQYTRNNMAGATVGDYLIFLGGRTTVVDPQKKVDVYQFN